MANVQDLEESLDSVLKLEDLGRPVKVDLRISRKMGLYLSMAVELSLTSPDAGNLLKRILSEEDRTALQDLTGEVLKKTKTVEFYALIRKLGKR